MATIDGIRCSSGYGGLCTVQLKPFCDNTIVATNSDFDFTVTNVIVHGVPYVVLLYVYARRRAPHAPDTLGSQIIAAGLGGFLTLLAVIAFLEELCWSRLVWHDHGWLFGESEVDLGRGALAFVVPLLTLPQVTHYVLDGMLWRRRDTRANPAQQAAIGQG